MQLALDGDSSPDYSHSMKEGRLRNKLSSGFLPVTRPTGVFALLIISGLVCLFGCSSDHLTRGHGDASHFILQRAITFGGRPIATNNLPVVGGEWWYVQDEFGLGVRLPAAQFQSVQTFLRSAFGPPSNSAGWAVRDFGVAIYVEIVGSNTVVGVYPPMSDEQLTRMWQKIGRAVSKSTK